jgi:hypothetical protein
MLMNWDDITQEWSSFRRLILPLNWSPQLRAKGHRSHPLQSYTIRCGKVYQDRAGRLVIWIYTIVVHTANRDMKKHGLLFPTARHIRRPW